MKFSYEIILLDIDNLLNHIQECIETQDGHSFSYIQSQYNSIIFRTPYDWYFCAGLCFDEVYGTYNSIKNALETLKCRLEIAKTHMVFQIEAVFEDIKPKIITEINKATSTMNIAVAWLSDNDITDAIINKAKQGVTIRIMLYESDTNNETIDKFKSEGNIAQYIVPRFGIHQKNLMHNKFATFDNSTVITGSYNWSINAIGNIENIVIIIDEDLARSFSDKFAQLIIQFSKYKM